MSRAFLGSMLIFGECMVYVPIETRGGFFFGGGLKSKGVIVSLKNGREWAIKLINKRFEVKKL